MGNLLCLIPGSVFPYDMLGGVGMAVCMVYIMYKQYLFDFSYRVTVGAVYFLAVVVASLPLVILSHNLENVLGSLERAVTQKLLIYIVLQCAWTVLVVAFARKRLEDILNQKLKHMLEGLRKFQDRAASILNRKELFANMHDILDDAIPGWESRIFEKNINDDGYHEVVQSGHIPLGEDEVERVCGIVEQEETKETKETKETPEIALLKYDNMVCGFVYMERLRESKLNYREADCIRQMANIASGSLKNIDAYERYIRYPFMTN